MQMQGKRVVVAVYFGEGAASEGDFPRIPKLCRHSVCARAFHLPQQWLGHFNPSHRAVQRYALSRLI